MPCSLFLQVLSSIIIKFIEYILLKINNERHRSFHFCRAVLSTHSFFFKFRPDRENRSGSNVSRAFTFEIRSVVDRLSNYEFIKPLTQIRARTETLASKC
jgi:hypothetical protein